jgi:Ca-activated chloride channel family protein
MFNLISLFQHKEYIIFFAALAVSIVLFFLLLRWKRKVKRRIGSARLVDALTANYSSRLFTVKFVLLLVAMAAGIIAVMNPRKPGGSENITRKGIDVAIALDVSKSMLAADLAPSRLERAKQFITKLMDQLPNDRIALVLFAGKAYMQMPLTVDHGAAAMYVNTAGPDAIPQQGTVITDALKMSANVFNSAEKRFKTIVLISDGEDHDENAAGTAADLAAQGVMINTIGVGSPEGAVIIDPATGAEKKDEAGNTVVSKLNEETLQEVAKETNGIYLYLQSSDETVSLLKAQLAQIDRKAFGDVSLMSFKTYYFWFAGIMFLLLLLENFLPEIKKRSGNKTAVA